MAKYELDNGRGLAKVTLKLQIKVLQVERRRQLQSKSQLYNIHRPLSQTHPFYADDLEMRVGNVWKDVERYGKI